MKALKDRADAPSARAGALPAAAGPAVELLRRNGHADPGAGPRLVWLYRLGDTLVGVLLFLSLLEVAGATAAQRGSFPISGFWLLVFVPVWYGVFTLAGLYDARQRARGWTELGRIALATSSAGGLLLLAVLPRNMAALPPICALWLGAPLATFALRSGLHAGARARRERVRRDILILGNGPRGRRLLRELQVNGVSRDRVVGFLDHPGRPLPRPVVEMTLGPLTCLERILVEGGVDEVVIALPIKSCYAEIHDAIRTCERVGVDCRYLADLFDLARAAPRYGPWHPRPMVTLKIVPDDYRVRVKRAIDIVASALGLLFLAPLFLAIALTIKVTSPGPVFFIQDRYGFKRRRFRMLKFRSMVANAPALQAELESQNEATGPLFKMRNDPRVTPLGRFLRRTSLDELPQLINVLLGDMSLVGPRPMALRDVDRFPESSLMRRFSVKPGITGLWQISGRSDLPFDKWIDLDLKYIDEWSFGLELRILWKTIPTVLSQKGAV
jgi:exopolysaccharide biosynthesis polyprenyl glycosylphosphotransferase